MIGYKYRRGKGMIRCKIQLGKTQKKLKVKLCFTSATSLVSLNIQSQVVFYINNLSSLVSLNILYNGNDSNYSFIIKIKIKILNRNSFIP